MKGRYYVRWRTETYEENIYLKGWDVCDRTKFDKITVRAFDSHEEAQARGLCKLLNSIEEENDGA
jgi:hypothetical protein